MPTSGWHPIAQYTPVVKQNPGPNFVARLVSCTVRCFSLWVREEVHLLVDSFWVQVVTFP